MQNGQDDIAAGLAALRDVAEAGGFDETGLRLLVVHGSATLDPDAANDLDVAVLFDPDRLDAVSVFNLLADHVGPMSADLLDVMDLRRAGPLARARALEPGCLPLHEDELGRFAEAQVQALTMWMEQAWLHEATLDALRAA